MSDVSRREAFKTLAAGAAGATVAATVASPIARAATTTPARGAPLPSWEVLESAAAEVRRLGRGVERREGMRSGEALVLHCRSWDGHVYLYVNEQVRGFVPVTASAFAIAAACQAAGRPVAVKHWGHDAHWGNGVGRFEGALLAVEFGDLPEDPTLA
jgi:hypothetical protein